MATGECKRAKKNSVFSVDQLVFWMISLNALESFYESSRKIKIQIPAKEGSGKVNKNPFAFEFQWFPLNFEIGMLLLSIAIQLCRIISIDPLG